MKNLVLFAFLVFSGAVFAEDSFLDAAPAAEQTATPAEEQPATETREPAATAAQPAAAKKTFPGGADEEDLTVQPHLPEAGLRIDARSVQREVFKNLYNQELKEDNRESLEE